MQQNKKDFIKIGPFDTKLLQKAHKWFFKKSCLHPVPKFGEKFGEKYREKFGTFLTIYIEFSEKFRENNSNHQTCVANSSTFEPLRENQHTF